MKKPQPIPRFQQQPNVTFHGPWIIEYPGDVFVVFDPMTDGYDILGATRHLKEAQQMLRDIE